MKNIAVVLVTSDYGHVLLDGGMPGSAQQIAASIDKLGFKPKDVKAILLSHAHPDHAGGLAELQQLTGAPVYASRPAAEALRTGRIPADDPQSKSKPGTFPKVAQVWTVNDDQLLGIGSNRLRAIATPGHTPGGMSWSWDSCDGQNCLAIVYADSLSPVASEGFAFGKARADGRSAADDLNASIARIAKLKCDVLVTVHPSSSQFMERVAKRPADNPAAIKDDTQCRNYAEAAKQQLDKRLAEEGAAK